MSYLDTNKLRHLVADGHILDRETVLDLLSRVERQQDRELRQLALDKHPIEPPPLDPDALRLGQSHQWDPTQAYGFDNPIFSIIQQITQSLSTYTHAHDLVIDPASIRIETDDTDGTYTTRVLGIAKPRTEKS